MRRLILTCLGLFAGYSAIAVAGIALADIARISQAEGAYMMGVFFFWAPMGAVIGAIGGYLMARPRARRKKI